MNKIIKIQKQKLWFSRWSHKPWAVFSSIKVVVHILRVKVNICQQSLLKQGTVHIEALVNAFSSEEILSGLIDRGGLHYLIFLNDDFFSIKSNHTLEEAQIRVSFDQFNIPCRIIL